MGYLDIIGKIKHGETPLGPQGDPTQGAGIAKKAN